MKKILLLSCMLAIGIITASANPSGLKKFYDKYSGVSGVISFKVPALLAQNFVEVEDAEAKAFLKQMDDLSFLVYDNAPQEVFTDLGKVLDSKSYVPIMVINDSGTKINFYMYLEGRNVEEIIMIVNEPSDLVIMNMRGDFTIDQAKELAKSLHVNDL